jgi:putative transposase
VHYSRRDLVNARSYVLRTVTRADCFPRRSHLGKRPSAAVIDAQSTRASPQGGESGFDAGKKVKGRKRNLVVDTMGLLIAVTVTAASVQDRMLPQPWLRKRAPRALD